MEEFGLGEFDEKDFKPTDILALRRTELAKERTILAMERTHLAYMRTIISLFGTSVTLAKALPTLGISNNFTVFICLFLLIAALYFTYKDISVCPRKKRNSYSN